MATGAIAGMIAGQLGQELNAQRQERQQEKLTGIQTKANLTMMQRAHEQNKEMWDYTNYANQVKHMKAAGLNPAMLFSAGAGAGGTVGSSSGGSAGMGQASDEAARTGMNIEAAMMGAQLKNLEAQTEKTKAEAQEITGIKHEEATARIADLWQGIKNKKAEQHVSEADRLIKGMQVIREKNTIHESVDKIIWEAKRAQAELEKAENEAYVARNTREESIKIIQESAIAGILGNAAAKKGIQKQESEINKIAQDMVLAWRTADREDAKLKLEEIKTALTKQFPQISGVAGRMFDRMFKKANETQPSNLGEFWKMLDEVTWED